MSETTTPTPSSQERLSLEEEVRDLTLGRTGSCKTCLFISELPDAEQAEWDAIMAKSPQHFPHAAIARAMGRRGVTLSANAVGGHRNAGHRHA